MEKATLSTYRYLTFLLPGALVLGVVVYGWIGWPYGEPGAGALLALTARSYMTGHIVVAIANYFQPIWWGNRPGGRLQSSEGLFDKAGRYSESRDKVLAAFNSKYPKVDEFEAQFGIAYQEAQKGQLGPKLLSMVEEIGYYRSMATASVICFMLVILFNVCGHDHLELLPWAPLFIVSAIAHAYRFRRFWRYVGEYVTGEVWAEESD